MSERSAARTAGLAVFLAVPPGVGASVAVQTATGTGFGDPVALGAFAVTALVIGLLVVGLTLGGEENLPEGPLDGGP